MFIWSLDEHWLGSSTIPVISEEVQTPIFIPFLLFPGQPLECLPSALEEDGLAERVIGFACFSKVF